MSQLPAIVTRVHDLTGDLVLDLSKDAGYWRQAVTGIGGVTWRTNTVSSAYVDGETESTPATRAALQRVERLHIKGDPTLSGDAYWASAEERLEDLVLAVSTRFLWVVSLGGNLWTYRSITPANVDAAEPSRDDLFAKRRPVTLSFKVQPNPTVEPIGGP